MDSGDKLIELLNTLVEEVELSDEDKQKSYSEFIKIYGGTFRHSYSEISQYFEDLYPDQRDQLEDSLKSIIEFAVNNNLKTTTLESVLKLYDHIQLERIRLARMDQMNRLTETSREAMEKNIEIIKNTKIDVKEAEAKVSHLHSETITILGIFAGLVIGFATSFQLFAQSFSNLNQVYFYKIIAYLALIGLILFDTIFFLLFAVSRVSKRSLAINCKYEDCAVCTNEKPCKYAIQKANKKYPYVVWFNIAMIAVLIIIVAWQTFIRLKLYNIIPS